MKALLHTFNALSWPLWIKLSAGFTLAIFIPALLVIVVAQNSFNDFNAENARRYITENGSHQQEAINVALGQAAAELERFTANVSANRQMVLTLQATGITAQSRVVATLFRDNLFDTGLYTLVRLLNTDGLIVAQSNAIDTLPAGVSNAESLTFIQAREAFDEGADALVTVLSSGIVELARPVVEEGQVFGYLIGTLDTERAILNNLALNGNIYKAYSYLVSEGMNPVLFVRREFRDIASAALTNSPAVARAFNGITDTDRYRLGTDRGQTVTGFYGPVFNPVQPDTPLFALVIEADTMPTIGESLFYRGGAQPFPLLVGAGMVLVVMVLLFNQIITQPLIRLRQAMQAITQGIFDAPVDSPQRQDEIGLLTGTFVDMREQVHTLLRDLEARIAARMRDINATHRVSQFAAAQRDLQMLLDEVVNLVIQHFPNIYHAQIFLLNTDRDYAVLRASTGEVGQLLLKRGHRLPVGSISVIGQVTKQGEVVVARDTTASQVHRRNEFLPDTRAELAIPLRIGDQVIGALDVQSRQRDAFSQDEILVLQTMADQLAVAIENARLYQESVRRMADIERANREATLATWQEYIYTRRQRVLASEAGVPTGSDLSTLRRRAIEQGRVVVGEATDHGTVPIAVPILLSGQILGAVEWELPVEHLDSSKLQLAQELANRLATSLDNARLFEESQRAAERERIVNTIAAKLTPQTEIAEILQMAVREVGQALQAPQVNIRLHQTNGKNEQR
ncbi:MAG: GAF domain-containing protein [Chloroflexi bacterium]|nr:GAF domain-containing protein [Chloroflexota bacterium]